MNDELIVLPPLVLPRWQQAIKSESYLDWRACAELLFQETVSYLREHPGANNTEAKDNMALLISVAHTHATNLLRGEKCR